jgi:lysophospholipid acyltransferase (LPLAT)-like uncharacterized protein
VSGWRVVLLWSASLLLRAWGRTLRLTIEPSAVAAATTDGRPVIFLVWHNRLFLVPRLLRILRPRGGVVALVSASRDGAALARFLDFLGVRAVRGSSSRFAREAMHELITALRGGHDIAITPDGPRGPRYDMKPGAWLTARRTSAPLVLVGARCGSAWRLRSWDRFLLPLPGSRVFVRCERVDANTLGHGNTALAALRARLLAINGEPFASGEENPTS